MEVHTVVRCQGLRTFRTIRPQMAVCVERKHMFWKNIFRFKKLCVLLASCWFLACLMILTMRTEATCSLKYWLTFYGLLNAMSQKLDLFISTATTTINPSHEQVHVRPQENDGKRPTPRLFNQNQWDESVESEQSQLPPGHEQVINFPSYKPVTSNNQ
jgi:hypothetical protein